MRTMKNKRQNQRLFFIEITDTYGGESNYSWVTRHRIKARSTLGAIRKIGNRSGLSWHKVLDYGDCLRYDSHSGATCAFVREYDPQYDSEYRFDTDDIEGNQGNQEA